MKFRTEIELPESLWNIEYDSKILTMGSCFAENIAEYFKANRFEIFSNPFGVLYNPISILNSIKLSVEKKKFNRNDLIFHQSEWHSFYHHSSFSNDKSDTVLQAINEGMERTHNFLKSADIIIITFGTAFVYKHIEKGIVVSNCHKIPQREFKHFMLSLEETGKAIKEIIKTIKTFNGNAKIIFTVSPVRHWKDGAVRNQLSKSTLLLSTANAIEEADSCEYFPSYEIVLDDLRDYRFYAEDLLHPNKMATDYIWKKFSKKYCSEKCLQIMNEVSKIVAARNHRIRNINSDEHQRFVNSIINKIESFHKKHNTQALQGDLQYFKSQLK